MRGPATGAPFKLCYNYFMKNLIFILTILFLTSCSCSKEEETYSPSDMWRLAQKAEPNIELVPIPTGMEHKRVLCKNYGPGCVLGSGKRIKVKRVELITIQFETVVAARKEARRLDQYHFANWLFDEVKQEPVLKHFVRKVFKAVNPFEEDLKSQENLERK